MTKDNQNNLNNIIENMYDARSLIRECYLGTNALDIYELAADIKDYISKFLNNKYKSIDVAIHRFDIYIELDDSNTLSNKKKDQLIEGINNIIRTFLYSHASQFIHNYISNNNNPLMDIYIIGNGIKLSL